jgi:hypothetical protein
MAVVAADVRGNRYDVNELQIITALLTCSRHLPASHFTRTPLSLMAHHSYGILHSAHTPMYAFGEGTREILQEGDTAFGCQQSHRLWLPNLSAKDSIVEANTFCSTTWLL